MNSTPDPSSMRINYDHPALETVAETWHTQFAKWFADAVAFGVPEPNAMIVATAGVDARPSARTVLLKGFDEDGFTFFTNYSSRKGRELTANPACSLVIPWYPMHRQVVVCGDAVKVSREESEAYFAQRPRGSQLGAWASPQSQVIEDRKQLEDAYVELANEFTDVVPAPPDWGGFRVSPQSVEFWQGRPSRVHDRLVYLRVNEEWVVERLAP